MVRQVSPPPQKKIHICTFWYERLKSIFLSVYEHLLEDIIIIMILVFWMFIFAFLQFTYGSLKKEDVLSIKESLNLNQARYDEFLASVQFSCSVVSDSFWPHGLQHTRPPCPLPTPRVYSNSRPLSQWCHPTISSSIIPFSSRLQSFLASCLSQWVSSLH